MLRLLALCLLLLATPLRAEVRAWLDRSDVALGETVTLNIEVQGAGVGQPDLAILQTEFDVLGTSSNSQISIVNGQRSATTLFAVALQPRREGVTTVPPLDVAGTRTEPLVLTVRPSPVSSGAGGDIFLEATVSPREPYVQQQAIYALKLYYAITVLDGQLDAPQPDGARVVRLGDDLKYQVERDGRRYVVIERRFAVVPERSGELALAAPRFEGRGIDRGGLGGMFGGGLRLSAVGEPLQLTVKPRPAAGAEPWLPAKSLSLAAGPDVPPQQVEVGQPLTLQIQLRAGGLAPEQLPELVLPPIDGAAVYPDQEVTRDRSTSDGLAGERSRRFAVVAQRPGVLEIPAMRIAWWNTDSDRAEVAELAARRIEVVAGGSTPASIDPGATADAEDADAPPQLGDAAGPEAAAPWWQQPWPWMLLCLLLAGGWAFSVWRGRRRPPTTATVAAPRAAPPPQANAASLRSALRDGDLSAIAATLRAMAGPSAHSLEDVAAALDDARQRNATLRLERCLYGDDADREGALADLQAAFARAPLWRAAPRAPRDADSELPPLYR